MNGMQVKEIGGMRDDWMDIGRTGGFLSLTVGGKFNESKRNIRASEIGKKRNEAGGMDAMRLRKMAVRRFPDVTTGREPEACRDRIGGWRG